MTRRVRGWSLWQTGFALTLAVAVAELVVGVIVSFAFRDRLGDAEHAALVRGMLAVGAAGVLLTGAGVAFASWRFSRQIYAIALGATRFARGHLDDRMPKVTAEPLAELAASLDAMAGQLGRRIDQLQAREHEQEVILQSMSNGVIALDPELRVLTINRAASRMFGVAADRVAGRLLAGVIRHPALHRFVDASVADPAVSAAEFTVQSDRLITVQARSERLIGTEGETRGFLVVLVDVTHLRRFESMRADFAANVSHELRTPITNIKGYVETLLEIGWDDREQATSFLKIVRDNGNRLAAIIEDVMSLTKLERPGAAEALEREAVSIRVLLEAVRTQFRGRAGEKSIDVVVDAGADVVVPGHGPLLEQALSNLLSNAIAYSPPNTTVHLAADNGAGMVSISVTDEGPGIAREHVDHLFERFYRVDKARSRKQGGTGLGLAIVKHIAQVHGGRVEVDSEVGVGSTFRLVLPVEDGGDVVPVSGASTSSELDAEP